MNKKERLKERNKALRTYYEDTKNKYPMYKNDYLLQKVADKFFLSIRTVEAIIYYEGTYNDKFTFAKT